MFYGAHMDYNVIGGADDSDDLNYGKEPIQVC